ncbi:RNA-directed DNA polymerase, eukaryota [Tanacetum coccineum]
MESIDLISVKLCWGNLRFDHVHSDSVGNSGGILCVWDSDSFRKDSVTVSDYFVIIRGVWLKTNVNLLIVVVYAPHDSRDKRILWDYLVHISNQWDGEVVMMGDFNEVRCKSDRFGSVFNARGADVFNSFIAEAGLVEVSLGGSVFTWCHKSASKMSKLDRFFISDNLLNTCPNISAVTLERYLSDHRPILLRESCFDYGPVPFRFYHYWLTLDGFDKFVKVTWREAPGDKVNALRNLMFKLKYLKVRIREWVSNKRYHSQAESNRLKADLAKLDDSIDKGMGTIDIVNKRTETLNSLHKLNYLQSTEAAQKAKVKWSVEGDENVRFFHGMINKKRSQQNIRGIMVDGQWIEEPGRVKNQFLQHFRDRFAAPDDDRIHIDMPYPRSLSNDQREDLECMVTMEEVKKAVWDCGIDKSPGPDGFSFGFYRHFWSIIDKEVFEAVKYFFIHSEIPKGCNSVFIALIPKIADANMVKDFRPISLIGSIYKIVTKILANRIVGVLGVLVDEVQSAFIAERQILDGPFILNEVMQWCKTKRKQAFFFKVDFEKAYDSVRWDFLDDILNKFGFGHKWRGWIRSCLYSSRGSIVVNGSPTEEFQFFKGLKQGDPLSPFLFILVMESLNISFQRVIDAGMFTGIKLCSTLNLSHLFYADDVMFVGQWRESNISTLVNVLECFHRASGLKINMSKSKILGINVETAKIKQAAVQLGCLILNAPFTYLGAQVGGSMSRVHSWDEVVGKVLARLSRWKMRTLSIGGRLTLIKSVLGSMPLFHMSIFKVPSSVLKRLESIRSRFFRGHDIGSNKAAWVKWSDVLAPKKLGGLGVSSLYALNRGLLFKWLWKFYAQATSLWARVIKAIHGVDGNIGRRITSGNRSCWTSIISEAEVLKQQGVNFFDFMQLNMGNGELTSFWEDKWHDSFVLKDLFPRLYVLETNKKMSVGEYIPSET